MPSPTRFDGSTGPRIVGPAWLLFGIVLLTVLIVMFGGVPMFLRRHDRYLVIFDEAPGVEVGTPVRRSGLRIGQVGSVALDPDTAKVLVGLLIDKGRRVYRSDRANLVYGLLSGDTNIDLVTARKDGVPVDLTPLEPDTPEPAPPLELETTPLSFPLEAEAAEPVPALELHEEVPELAAAEPEALPEPDVLPEAEPLLLPELLPEPLLLPEAEPPCWASRLNRSSCAVPMPCSALLSWA